MVILVTGLFAVFNLTVETEINTTTDISDEVIYAIGMVTAHPVGEGYHSVELRSNNVEFGLVISVGTVVVDQNAGVFGAVGHTLDTHPVDA